MNRMSKLDRVEQLMITQGKTIAGAWAVHTAKYFGRRCADYDADCAVCKAWRAYDLICEVVN